MEVDFLDVGQGDAVLIKAPGAGNILIDGGPDSSVIKRLGEVLPWWDRKIDLMVLTHPHADHLTGEIEVMKRYKVRRILYTGVTHTSSNYLSWLETARNKKIPVTIIDRPQAIKLGKADFKIIYPSKSFAGLAAENLNNTSIAGILEFGKTRFFLTGDIEEDIEKELAASGMDLRANVLKVGHQGSNTSTGEEFLEKVKPEIAVIEVGAGNEYGHPSPRTLKKLERIGAKIMRTDLEGTIRLISDGERVNIKGD